MTISRSSTSAWVSEVTGPILPPEREGRPASADLIARHESMAAVMAARQPPLAIAPKQAVLGGISVLRFRPEGAREGALVHFHGGGFRIGSPHAQVPYHAALAEACRVEIIVPWYRLAPEHPFPAALVDALTVVCASRGTIGEAPLIVAGDSAGGGLAASLGILAQQGEPRIDGILLHSPWLDLTVAAPAYADNAASDPLFSQTSAEMAAEAYLQGMNARHPLASPLFAGIDLFPPSLITVGTGEVLRDDSIRFHEKLRAAGMASGLLAIDGMEHCAVTRGMELAGAVEAFARSIAFVDAVLRG